MAKLFNKIKGFGFRTYFILGLSIIVLSACGASASGDRLKKDNQVEALFSTDASSETTERKRYTIEYSEATTEVISVELTEYVNPALNPENPDYEAPIGEADSSVDIDLCVLTDNMRYSMLFEIYSKPDNYLGKTVKINGTYRPYFDERTNKNYHYLMIKDKLACCENGIEFIWDDNSHAYPEEYPNEGDNLVISGKYSVYNEVDESGNDKQYYYIDIDDIER